MLISDLLAPADVLFDLRARDKDRVLQAMARRAADALGIDGDTVIDALRRREALGSTGIGGGIALPHARLSAVTAPYGVLARLRTPIAFESVDDRPVDLVFLLLLPVDPLAEPVNALACAARRLRDRDVVANLRRAASAADLYPAIAGAAGVAVP